MRYFSFFYCKASFVFLGCKIYIMLYVSKVVCLPRRCVSNEYKKLSKRIQFWYLIILAPCIRFRFCRLCVYLKMDGEIKQKFKRCMKHKATNSLTSFITMAETFYGWRQMFSMFFLRRYKKKFYMHLFMMRKLCTNPTAKHYMKIIAVGHRWIWEWKFTWTKVFLGFFFLVWTSSRLQC